MIVFLAEVCTIPNPPALLNASIFFEWSSINRFGLQSLPSFAKFALCFRNTAYILFSETLKCFLAHFFLSSAARSEIGPLDSDYLGTAVRILGLYFPMNFQS